MKKIYEKCKIEIITFESSDVLTGSKETWEEELPLIPIDPIEGGIEGA